MRFLHLITKLNLNTIIFTINRKPPANIQKFPSLNNSPKNTTPSVHSTACFSNKNCGLLFFAPKQSVHIQLLPSRSILSGLLGQNKSKKHRNIFHFQRNTNRVGQFRILDEWLLAGLSWCAELPGMEIFDWKFEKYRVK